MQTQIVSSLKEAEGRLTDTITRLETDISKATPNMRAGERLAATEARLAAIDADFASTRKRAAAAKKAFDEVRQRRHDLFMKAFTHISENISGTYKDLTKSTQFPLGGQAYLDMEDSTEPYLAGLKYHAMPPLKRFRDMEHLSGGEKTIAALALLFAIHSYQPSPFFVLDEVDAALDNVNVGRVAKYVREHASPGMQFIVISLKAGFFQESETLVGVMRDQTAMSSKYLSLDVSFYLLVRVQMGGLANECAVEEVSGVDVVVRVVGEGGSVLVEIMVVVREDGWQDGEGVSIWKWGSELIVGGEGGVCACWTLYVYYRLPLPSNLSHVLDIVQDKKKSRH